MNNPIFFDNENIPQVTNIHEDCENDIIINQSRTT